jgi:diguanylate cyclase
MSDIPDPSGTAPGADVLAGAGLELEHVQRKVEATRAVLLRLLQEVVVAESRLSSHQSTLLLEANEQLVVTAMRNHSEAQTSLQALTDMTRSAEFDALTQLPNRMLLLDRLARAMANAKRRGTRLALLFLDLNDFKHINDTLGHAAGDEVLQQVAQRLGHAVREADTVSRHGGDEFLILLTEVSQPADAAVIAGKLLSVLEAPCEVDGQRLDVHVSIGISVYPEDGTDIKTLIDCADAAMYSAKLLGPGSQFALHGELTGPPARRSGPAPGVEPPHEQTSVRHERRRAQLQEANEQLVLAALGAQELQAAAERAQQRQADFITAVTQELDNPFAPIRLATAMLGRRSTDEPLLPRVQALIEQQVQQMAKLVDAASQRPSAPYPQARPAPPVSDLAAVIDLAVQDFRAAMDLRRQSLAVLVAPGPLPVRGDAGQLLQMLGNLLGNASQYTPDGGSIRLEAAAQGDQVVLTVIDDGIGIAPSAMPGIFDPFWHESYAIGFNGVGVGIGLPAVRALVSEMGGTVTAESAGNGCGSRFTVTLPLAAAEAASPTLPDPTRAAP